MSDVSKLILDDAEYDLVDESARERLDALESTVGDIDVSGIAAMKDAVAQNTEGIATLKSDLASTAETASANASAIEDLQGDASANAKSIAAIKKTAETNAAQIMANKAECDAVAERVTTAEGNIDQINTDASALTERVGAAETVIATLETNENTIQEDLTALKSTVDTHTTEIGDLSTLTTTAKDTLVDAINEAAASGGSSGGDPNALAMLWGKDYEGNRTSTVSYNSDGNVSSISETGDGNTATRTYTYDSDGRITKEAVTGTTPDGSYTKTKELTYSDSGATKIVETYQHTASDPTWAEIATEVQSGIAEVKYKVGDLLSDTWNNGSSTYTYPWRVMGFRDVELEDGSTKRAMILMAEYTDGHAKHFSEYEAFYYAENGLSAGTYTMTVNGTDMSFTLTKDVPAGGRLAPNTGGSFASNCRSYDADGTTLLENFTMASGTDGTDLGDIVSGYIPNGNINGYDCAYYGLGRWSQSTIRMWLNSTADKGQWFDKTKKFATPPSWLSSYKGYLGGLPEDLQDVILPIKVTTYPASSISSSAPDITYDKVWLPSLEEMYISPQINGEGDSLAYYKALNGTSTKWSRSSTHAELKKYSASSHSLAQAYWTRSAYRDYAYCEWYVASSGHVGYSAAYDIYAAAPLVAIG